MAWKSSVKSKLVVVQEDQEATMIWGRGLWNGMRTTPNPLPPPNAGWPPRPQTVSAYFWVPDNKQRVFHLEAPQGHFLSLETTPVSRQSPKDTRDLAGGKRSPRQGCGGLWARGRAAQAPIPHAVWTPITRGLRDQTAQLCFTIKEELLILLCATPSSQTVQNNALH